MESIYSVIKQQNDKGAAAITINLAQSSHPVFQAHFPGNPLLPGYMQIDILAEILQKRVVSIDKAKFHHPLFPDDRVTFELLFEAEKVRVKSYKDETKCSEFTLELR